MQFLRRAWSWVTASCAACHIPLYFGARLYSSQQVYCSWRCYQIGLLLESSARKRRAVPHD